MRRKLLYSFGILFSLFIISFVLSSCDLFKNMVATKKPEPETEPEDVEDDGKTIYFGSYPQKKVENESIINQLNSKAGSLPTEDNLYQWSMKNLRIYFKDNYHKENEKEAIFEYMYFQDIDFDNNGTYDYRGLYCVENDSHYNRNGYENEKLYWFKFEPIKWNILEEVNGKAFVVSKMLLDNNNFEEIAYENYKFDHNGGNGNVNNYELSDLRKWLINDFYNIAFNDTEKASIETTTVDNSAESTSNVPNEFVCNNTNDKIFLLSYKELVSYYPNDDLRIAYATDYSKCRRIFVEETNGSSYWWLRSPMIISGDETEIVYPNGDIASFGSYNFFGIRPACWINL